MEALVQRLVQNPHDQDAITQAHTAGQRDPKAYAMLLEKVGTATSDPAFAAHWLTEAANVWSVTLGDAHRAARALMIAIDRAPAQPRPAERLGELYREKGDTKALVALLERRAKALAPLAPRDPQVQKDLAGIHEELGRSWASEPLLQPKKAIDNYRRAIELDPTNQFAIYSLRELHKAAGQWAEALPYFEMELALVTDPERRIALRQDEGEARRSAGDFAGATVALRDARRLEGGNDPTLKQLLGTVILEREQAGQRVSAEDAQEGADLFVSLAEEYPGEHGLSYSLCALELEPAHDRAMQLALYYGGELGRLDEVGARAAAYAGANPNGAMLVEAHALAQRLGQPIPPAPAPRAPRGASGAHSLRPAVGSAPPPAAGGSGAVALPTGDNDQVGLLIEQAMQLARKARKNDAAQKYREVLAIEPANLDAIAFLEAYLKQLRKFAELRDVLRRAAQDDGIDVEQRISWLREVAGLSETQLRDPNGAVAALEELLALDPESEDSRASLKRLLERANRWDDLARVLEAEAEVIGDVEARISAERAIARLHEQKRKDPVGAGEAWTRIAALVPEDESALDTAVEFFEKGGRPDRAAQAIADSLPAINDDETRGRLLEKLGELRLAAGETASAGEAFSESATVQKSAAIWEKAERAFAAAEAWEQAASAAGERAQLAGRPTDQAKLYAIEAGYLTRAGDEGAAVERLEQATELDPIDDALSAELERRFEEAERLPDLVQFLLRRAQALQPGKLRSSLRSRAADMQRDRLGDGDAARETLLALLEDGDDIDALVWLADDAEQRGDASAAADFLGRLSKAATDPEQRTAVLLREAALYAGTLSDPEAAIARYERILDDIDANHDEALAKVAELYDGTEQPGPAAAALERRLKASTVDSVRLDVANKLADLYEGPLDDPKNAVRALDVVRGLDPEDFGAVQRLAELCEKIEDWPRVAEHLAELMEVEGDDEEVSRMTRRRAEILHQKVGKGDEALAVLLEVADRGDILCREEYIALGDELGWKGVVAVKLVEWNVATPAGPKRTEALRGAFDRFLEVERKQDAAMVGTEIARAKGTDAEFAERLEKLAVELRDLDVLAVAHDLLVQDRTGPGRAAEFVRQAEVLLECGVEPAQAVQHGEQALTSVAPTDVEPLLERLARLTTDKTLIIEIYERQVTRCKNPADKLAALARAARIAAAQSDYDRARGFFDIVLGAGAPEEAIELLEEASRASDVERATDRLRRVLAEALAAGGQGARDGGRTRSAMLGRAARIAFEDLGDREQAFVWIGDAVVAHVGDERLEQLEVFAAQVGDLKRAETVIGRALEEVFDGPLVRKLLARRAGIRRDQLSDPQGAAADLRRLHDLSPGDAEVVDQLLALFTELRDFRGMVQLYEDQILRGKDPSARAELARKVARLWEEKLDDPREAADAWRRVLRMKQGDPEASEGLERAKTGMLKRSKEEAAKEEAGTADEGPPPDAKAGKDAKEGKKKKGKEPKGAPAPEYTPKDDGAQAAPLETETPPASVGDSSELPTARPPGDGIAPLAPPLGVSPPPPAVASPSPPAVADAPARGGPPPKPAKRGAPPPPPPGPSRPPPPPPPSGGPSRPPPPPGRPSRPPPPPPSARPGAMTPPSGNDIPISFEDDDGESVDDAELFEDSKV